MISMSFDMLIDSACYGSRSWYAVGNSNWQYCMSWVFAGSSPVMHSNALGFSPAIEFARLCFVWCVT